MELHLTAAGTPDQIMASLNRDVSRERGAHPEYAGALAGVRDAIAKQIGAGQTLEGDQSAQTYTVSAKIEISVDAQANALGLVQANAYPTQAKLRAAYEHAL